MKRTKVHNDDAPKRSGAIEKGTRSYQELVTVNASLLDENMEICFCEFTNGACMENDVEHDETERQICNACGFVVVVENL
jgi:hypothetical protein